MEIFFSLGSLPDKEYSLGKIRTQNIPKGVNVQFQDLGLMNS